MASLDVGDQVQMLGVPFVVEVLEIGTCEDGADCPLGSEIFRFKDPNGQGDDWMHSSEFEKVTTLPVEVGGRIDDFLDDPGKA